LPGIFCYNAAITAVISDPTFGKEVGSVFEILAWLIDKIGAATIAYGVREVLDYLFKRR